MKPSISIKLQEGKAAARQRRIGPRPYPLELAKISDQLQTPLGVILSSAEILDSYSDRLTSERRSQALGDILGAARDMAHLLEQLRPA